MAYITTTDLLNYINELTGGVQTSFTAGETAALQVFVDEAIAEIDRVTGRKFETQANQTRYYREEAIDPVDPSILKLDTDFLAVTALTNGDGTSISSGDYWLLPDNSSPKWAIKLKSTKSWAFDTDGRVIVAGSTGFSATAPADIKRCAKRLAYFYWQKRAATGETQVVGEDQVNVASEYPQDIKSVLARYKRGSVK